MSYTVRPVEIPDFNATWDRAQASRQNALAMQMQQREWQQSAEFDNALRQYGPALMGQDATARTNALSALGGLGGRGLAAAAPFHQTEQQRFRTMTPQEVAAAGFRPGTVARVNALGAIQTDQASDVLSPEAERQRLRITAAGRAPPAPIVLGPGQTLVDRSGTTLATGPVNPSLSPAEANGVVSNLGPRIAAGQIAPGSPEFNRYSVAYALATRPRVEWVSDPSDPSKMVPQTFPGINLDPRLFPNPIQGAAMGAAAPAGAAPAQPAAVAPPAPAQPAPAAAATAQPGAAVSRPAPGGVSPEGHPGDTAAKVALVREGVRAVSEVATVFAPRDGAINRMAIAQAWGNVPGSEGARLRNLVENAIGNRLRIESGAAASDAEVKRLTERYLPRPYMNDREIQQRLRGLQTYFSDFETAILPGGRRVPAAGEAPTPDAAALRSRYGLE